jgi:hypothetical protein
MPKPAFKSVSDITSALLQPALTSHFLVEINTSALGSKFTDFLNNNKVGYIQENLNLMCSEATLPGSSLATLEINSDFTGVTERHAYRRIYDDRIDLTFYVDAENYMPIRFFETWIKFIVDESITGQDDKGAGSGDSNYFYRVRYPDEYNKSTITITKFERTSKSSVKTSDYTTSYGNYTGKPLLYQFINCYPISISSMPVSYDSSSLLKCTVSMTYTRYLLSANDQVVGSSSGSSNSTGDATFTAATPAQQANFNTTSTNLSGTGALSTSSSLNVGGVPTSAANASGNTVSGFTVGANSNIA